MDTKEFLKEIEENPDVLKVKDVAKVLKVSPKTVQKGIKSGTLPIGFCVELETNKYIIPSERFLVAFKGLDIIDRLIQKEKRIDEMLNTLQMQLDILNDQIYFANKQKNVAHINSEQHILKTGSY